ncbi:MAG: hypothetical protein LUP95_02020, partial [Euryarchaeota archaeon]|nr:hypothetical protein [Euryarchaeota archaeon]
LTVNVWPCVTVICCPDGVGVGGAVVAVLLGVAVAVAVLVFVAFAVAFEVVFEAGDDGCSNPNPSTAAMMSTTIISATMPAMTLRATIQLASSHALRLSSLGGLIHHVRSLEKAVVVCASSVIGCITERSLRSVS